MGARLQRVHLVEAHLDGTLLMSARMEAADLLDADLLGALLSQARLDEAVLAGAQLTRTNLAGVDLSAVVGLTWSHLRRAAPERFNDRGAVNRVSGGSAARAANGSELYCIP